MLTQGPLAALRGVPVMLLAPGAPVVDAVEAALRAAGAAVERVHPRDNWRWWFFERLPSLLVAFLLGDAPEVGGLAGALAIAELSLHAPVLAVCASPSPELLGGVSDVVDAGRPPAEIALLGATLLGRWHTEQGHVAGNVALDPDGQTAWIDGRPMALTRTEFALLACLMAHSPRVLTRERLRAELWPDGAAPSARAVDVHLTRLRAKLADARGVRIATIRGLGYRLHLDPAA